MPPAIASIVFGIGVVVLFYLDRREGKRGSWALWIPTIWLFFCASRPLTEWLQLYGAPSETSQAASYVDGSPLDAAVLLAIEAAAFIVVIFRWQKIALILRRNWAIVAFFAYAGLSIAWSNYPLVTFKHWIKGIGDVVMVLIVLSEPDVTEAIRRIVTRLGFVLLAWSLLLIDYYPSLGRAYSPGGTPEPVGVATQKNSLGVLCDCIGIALVWRFRNAYIDRKDRKRVRRMLAYSAAFAIALWLLHLCNSMTSICALGMASGVMLLALRPSFRRRTAYVHLLVSGVLIVTSYALFLQSSGSLLQSLGRNPTLTGRTDVWRAVLGVPFNHLTGTGYQSFWLGSRLQTVQSEVHQAVMEAHNGYIEVFLHLGWIGLILLGAVIGTGYRNVIVAYRRDPDVGSFRIAWFLAVLITAFSEAAFGMMGVTWICLLLATMDVRWNGVVQAADRGISYRSPQAMAREFVGTQKTSFAGPWLGDASGAGCSLRQSRSMSELQQQLFRPAKTDEKRTRLDRSALTEKGFPKEKM